MNERATAQGAFRLMLRERIAPALRELGFRRGPSPGAFRYETGTHAAEARFIKSRGSTTREADFWVDLRASDMETEFVYWHRPLDSLDLERPTRWEVRAGNPVEPVASEVLLVFRSYGWPAIQAALDSPGYPPDATVRWPRTFPKSPRGPQFDDEAEAERRSEAELAEIMEQADSDPRTFQALLARLDNDPDPGIRQQAAWFLLRHVHEERSRQALRTAAAQDEDVEVRWIARYALRLAQRETSADMWLSSPTEAAAVLTGSVRHSRDGARQGVRKLAENTGAVPRASHNHTS